MIDKDEYPQTAELEMRCVNMLAHLFHSPDVSKATGCSTTGSSEAADARGSVRSSGAGSTREKAQRRPADRPNIGDGHQRAGLLGKRFCQTD